MSRPRLISISCVAAVAALAWMPTRARADGPADLLSGAGLYTNLAAGTISPDCMPFAPNYQLWSDGASKRRWMCLPAGAQIDTSDMDHWIFPAGTKVFKEFTRDGVVVETRMIYRFGAGDADFVYGAYVWKPDHSDASWTTSGVRDALGTPHDVPAESDCLQCHQTGEPGHVLGFSAVQLPPDLIRTLAAAGRFTSPPAAGADFTVPGTAVERRALGMLHANCGTCHNDRMFPAVTGMPHFRLSVNERTVKASAPWRTAVDVSTRYFRHGGELVPRIAPGDAAGSAVVIRLTARGSADQMPPVGTELVSTEMRDAVSAWIDSIPSVAAGCQPVINEVKTHGPLGHDMDEFVELYNPCSEAIAFDATWRLVAREPEAAADVQLKNLNGLTIPARGYLLLTGQGYSAAVRGDAVFDAPPTTPTRTTGTTGTITLGGRTVTVRLPAGVKLPTITRRFGIGILSTLSSSVTLVHGASTVDSVAWGTPDAPRNPRGEGVTPIPPVTGQGLGRAPTAQDTDDNLRDFLSRPPTPKAANL